MSRTDTQAIGARTTRFFRRLAVFIGGVSVIAVCVAVRYWMGTASVSAQRPQHRATTAGRPAAASTATVPTAPKPVATVNGEQISRAELANECFRYYGKDVLSSLVHKNLVAQFCQQRGITVDSAEVKAEIDRMAERFGAPTDAFLEMLQKERDITPRQYARDIIWPSLALRKIAAQDITVSSEEVLKAYQTQFGAAVQTRLIALPDLDTARDIRAQAVANQEDFGNLAKRHSIDTASASAKGRIQPIRRHTGDPGIEQVAFNLQEGAISKVIQVGNQYVILKCEKHIPPRNVRLEGRVQKLLEDAVRDKKLRGVADKVFDDLKTKSRIEIIYNNPQKRRAQPNVAAVINGQPLSINALADECIARHGKEVLAGMISRKVVERACRQHKVTFTDADVDAEIERAALSMGKATADGRPDVEAWLKEITEEHEISRDIYIRNEVIPSVKLKKLVGARVKVTEEDLRKGFEANFGPVVRCLAIVLNSHQRANEVFNMANKNRTPENFADLAEQFSFDASTRIMRGEIPPIRRHGGRPLLEKEAFSLNADDPLSAIVQVADRFVILYFLALEEPAEPVPLEDVRDSIYREIHEKKLRVAMAREFSRLYQSASIVNELAGTSQSPKKNNILRPPRTGQRAKPITGAAVRPRAGSNTQRGTLRR